MSVKVKVQLDQEKLKQLHQSHLQALEMTAQSTLDDIKLSQVVPKDTSALEDSSFVDITGIKQGYAKVIFDTPYARRLYYHPEYNFRTDKNPNAQGEWMQVYIDGPKENFIRNAYAENLKRLARGIIK